MHYRRVFASTALIAVLVSPLAADWPVTEKLDLDAIYRIKEEGLQRSKVMEIESYLTDVYGPRLTGSPNIKEAADWAQKTMKEWGLANVHLETCPFGRGWQNQRFVAHALTPRAYPLIALSESVDAGHERAGHRRSRDGGRSRARRTSTRYRGKLRGKFVLAIGDARRAAAVRGAGAAATPTPSSTDLAKQPAAGRGRGRGNVAGTQAFDRKRTQFWIDEGVAAVLDIEPRRRRHGVRADAAARATPSDPPSPPQVVLAVEHYGRIARTLEKKIPVTLQMDIDNRFYDDDLNAFNIVAELPGTDKADEVVMLGAHFDSWHTGTGATDNAAGLGGDDGSDAAS